MKAVHIFRKPCSESTVAANMLKHGTGALNIGLTRIKHVLVVGGSLALNPHLRQGIKKGRSLNPLLFDLGDNATVSVNPAGRWPANIVLQHLDGCVQDGSKTVKGAGHYPSARPAGSQISGPAGHTGQVNLTERDLKEETVTAWTCADGCPVTALDGQSGELTSGTWNGHRNNAKTTPGIYAPFVLRDEVGTHGSKGGASRFFKQVKP